jgi:hypothetical protein
VAVLRDNGGTVMKDGRKHRRLGRSHVEIDGRNCTQGLQRQKGTPAEGPEHDVGRARKPKKKHVVDNRVALSDGMKDYFIIHFFRSSAAMRSMA